MIIDKFGFDYKKPCGGGLVHPTLEEFPYLKSIVTHTTTNLRVNYMSLHRNFTVTVNMVARDEMRKLMIRRLLSKDENNHRLSLLYNTSILNVDLENHRIITAPSKLNITYDHLIGADGANSIVAKSIGFKTHKVLNIIRLFSSNDNIPILKNDTLHIEFLPKTLGYFWIFPKGNHLNVGIGGDLNGKRLRELFELLLTKHGLDLCELTETYRSAHLIPIHYSGISPWNDKHNIILCGDAAGFVNPLTGEGLYFALKSGQEAGEVICKKRYLFDYPSFDRYLLRLQTLKNTLDGQNTSQTFKQLFCDDETAEDTMEFLTTHYIPEHRILTEEEKTKIYDKL